MKEIIIYTIGYGLSILLIVFSALNFRRDWKRSKKLKELVKGSTDKISETLHKNKSDIETKMVLTTEQFQQVQKIVADIVYNSDAINQADKSYFLSSMYQPSLQGQEYYLSNLFTASGATGSFFIKEIPDKE